MQNMTEEEQLRWALEASLQDSHSPPLLSSGLAVKRNRTRCSLFNRQDKHNKLSQEVDGTIQQYNTLDQFGPLFEEAKRTHTTAAAICGYLSCANAILLEKFIVQSMQSGQELTHDCIRDFTTNVLSNIDQVLPETLECMASIQERRHHFWQKQTLEKASQSSLQEWVANFEISDYFKTHSVSGLPSPTVFVRYNQWPELDDATPDERERLQEEKRFGGQIVSQNGKKSITYGENDSVYFLEIFESIDASTFHTPEDFDVILQGSDCQSLPRVLILDLNGHFVTALACCIANRPQLFVFNTTRADYISNNMAVAWTFDSMFAGMKNLTTASPPPAAVEPKREEEGETTGCSGSSAVVPLHVVLLGDSTLDNVVWISNPQTSVTSYLHRYVTTNIHPQSHISNYAADGFTSGDVLHGGKAAISYRARINAGDPFPDCIASDFTFRPLTALHDLTLQDLPPTHLVLSVGGNDIRHILKALHTLPQVIQTLQSNYMAIVRHLCTEYPAAKLVLMFQYRPSWTQEHQSNSYGVYSSIDHIPAEGNISSVEKLHSLMETLYTPMLSLAAELQLPIVDLPNSFDIHNEELYSHQIEPSATGGSVIAHMLGEVMRQHDFTSSSRLYSMDTSGVGESSSTCCGANANASSISSYGSSSGSGGVGLLRSVVNDCNHSNKSPNSKWTITARA